jgi:hypothetical protein
LIYCGATFLLINFLGSKFVLDRNLTFVLPIVLFLVVLAFGPVYLARVIKPIDAATIQPVIERKKENPFVFYFSMLFGGISFWLWSQWLGGGSHLSSDETFLSGVWLGVAIIVLIQLIFAQGTQNAHR